ncbi:MAG: cyclic nucleotide-binding domain-containing protein [Elusimicrobia bacterium]|nr:cyclic nucleotide-binding domain-containing protein [Elusimicrobiota bacterium]
MVKLRVGEAEMGVLARTLHKVEFFSPLTVGQLEMVLPYISLYGYDSGETVFRQGEVGDAFYIVHTGQVAVQVRKSLFFKKTVATLGPGSFFGEIALVSRTPRNATIKALEPAQLFTLVAADFDFVLKQNPAAKAEMERIAARRQFESSHQ